MHLVRAASLTLVGVGSLSPASAAAQEIWYVDVSAAGPSQDGLAWCTAFLELQNALAVASAGDEIRVANGTYSPDRGSGQIAGDRLATFHLRRSVALRGGYAGCGASAPDARDYSHYETVLSGDLARDDLPGFANRGDNSFHVVTNDDTLATDTTILEGFTVSGGYANGDLASKTDQGSGMHNHSGVAPLFGGRPLLSGCVFKDNWAANHGAVNDHGGMTIVDCEFRDNHAGQWGGGLYIHATLPTSVTDCRFINNQTDGASGGGGGVVHEGAATFTRCDFSGNRSRRNGGGMYHHGGATPTLVDCVFEGNVADDGSATSDSKGGGMYSQDSTVSLSRCTFRANSVEGGTVGGGGGFYSINTGGTVSDCLFDSNLSDYSAGAIYFAAGETPVVRNCDFVANRAYWGAGIYANGPNSPDIRGCIFRDGVVSGYGAGVRLFRSDARLSWCQFWNNRAVNHGGALSSTAATNLLVTHCRFFDNRSISSSSFKGGAIGTSDALITISNSAFIKNASSEGGALFVQGVLADRSVTIINCTFAENAAPTGTAVAVATMAGGTTNLTVANSILSNGGGEIAVSGPGTVNTAVSYSFVQGGWPGPGNLTEDPQFADLDGRDDLLGTADDSVRLSSTSPCIDAANTSVLPPDIADVDDDGDTTEPTPLDLSGDGRLTDHPSAPGGGNPPPPVSWLDMGALEYGDCNGNGVFDDLEIANGTSTDCNANELPDECEPDCNANGVPDDCDLASGSSDCNANGVVDACEQDCNANGVADGCEEDCNANAAPDDCDVASGASSDANANLVPDECEMPKNRYLTLVTAPGGEPLAYRVTVLRNAFVGELGVDVGWIGQPNAAGVSRVVGSPYFSDRWPRVLQLADCEITPAADYAIAGTPDGATFQSPMQLSTAARPSPKNWGDTVGSFGATGWTAPNGVVNTNDFLAVVQSFLQLSIAPPASVADVSGVGTSDPCLNGVVSIMDVFLLIKAFQGDPYPFLTDPTACPPCP
ncbi:MAG: right-handed parallel beta-helix repeat-containing protein [Planctomycetes bacterium]|nr:right-handed parallel beta-helix repeat-containing protein [Planctomycetota bacterium]